MKKILFFLLISLNCYATDFYWTGGATFDGTGDWNDVTNWSRNPSCSYAPAATLPTASDDVYFESCVAAGTITIDALFNPICHNINFTGWTGRVTQAKDINIRGDFTGDAGVTWDNIAGAYSVIFDAVSGCNLSLNGMQLGSSVVIDNNEKVVLQSDFVQKTTNFLDIVHGEFDTNGFNATVGSFVTDNSGLPTTLDLTNNFTIVDDDVDALFSYSFEVVDASNFTFNRNSSTVIFASTSSNSKTCYIDVLGSTSANFEFNNVEVAGGVGEYYFLRNTADVLVFNNFKINNPVGHVISFNPFDVQTLHVDGTIGNLNTFDFGGLTLTMPVGVVCLSYVDLTGIDGQGATYYAQNSTDSGGNNNITFSACPGGGFPYSFGTIIGQ